jgi:hypothetical protein
VKGTTDIKLFPPHHKDTTMRILMSRIRYSATRLQLSRKGEPISNPLSRVQFDQVNVERDQNGLAPLPKTILFENAVSVQEAYNGVPLYVGHDVVDATWEVLSPETQVKVDATFTLA